MNTNQLNAIISFVVSAIIVAGMALTFNNSDPGSLGHTLSHLLGGKMPDGIIYLIMYAVFIYSMLDMVRIRKKLSTEELSLKMNLLPEKEQFVLSPDDVNDIKLKMVNMSGEKSLLVELIKTACTKYRANKSVGETLSVVSAQTEINLRNTDSELNLVKYLGWAIQSLGLVGTVFGLSYALSFANQISTPGGIDKVTSFLGTAFNTTLVAIMLTIILMFVFTRLQNFAEKVHSNIESYVLDNLINRIYAR